MLYERKTRSRVRAIRLGGDVDQVSRCTGTRTERFRKVVLVVLVVVVLCMCWAGLKVERQQADTSDMHGNQEEQADDRARGI